MAKNKQGPLKYLSIIFSLVLITLGIFNCFLYIDINKRDFVSLCEGLNYQEDRSPDYTICETTQSLYKSSFQNTAKLEAIFFTGLGLFSLLVFLNLSKNTRQ